MGCVIGPVVAAESGFMVCSMLEQTDTDPIQFEIVGYAVFTPEGAFIDSFQRMVDAIGAMRDEIIERSPGATPAFKK